MKSSLQSPVDLKSTFHCFFSFASEININVKIINILLFFDWNRHHFTVSYVKKKKKKMGSKLMWQQMNSLRYMYMYMLHKNIILKVSKIQQKYRKLFSTPKQNCIDNLEWFCYLFPPGLSIVNKDSTNFVRLWNIYSCLRCTCMYFKLHFKSSDGCKQPSCIYLWGSTVFALHLLTKWM